MKYKSKKDNSIIAAFDFEDEKCHTTRLIYLTGEKAGSSFVISNSTLKRWWTKVEADDLEAEAEIINTPYNPPVTPHYIPKPDSVIEYEANKRKAISNNELPEFDDLVTELEQYLSKINETSKYVVVRNSQTTVWRKLKWIDVYADELIWGKLVEQGLKSKPNKDKYRPYNVRIETADDYGKFKNAIEGLFE